MLTLDKFEEASEKVKEVTLESNFCKSSMVSPTPIYLTGIPSSEWIATAIPPFAVPSIFVRMIPVISATSENCLACASEKVKEVTLETKLVYSDFLSEQTGNKVY